MTLPMQVGYLVAGITQRSLLGGILTLFNRPLYSHYIDILRIGALSPLADQRLAGGIMWFASGLILLGATIVAIWRAPNNGPSPTPTSIPGSIQAMEGVQGPKWKFV
jgi:cytochrome c oxidase assembly factor CtaG